MLLRKSRSIAAYRLRKHATPLGTSTDRYTSRPAPRARRVADGVGAPEIAMLSQAPRTTAPASHTDPWQRPTLDVGASGIRLPDSKTERARRGAGRPTATLESRMARSVAR